MHAASTVHLLPALPPQLPRRARTGVFRRNARKVERKMILQSEVVYALRDKYPLMMNLLTVIRRLSSVMAGL